MAITREIKDINRFRQIVSVLLEEGFFYLIEKIKLGSWIRFKKKNLSKEKIPAEVRLRKTLERLEQAGIIKREGYDLAPPFERHYLPNQEFQQSYFLM